MNRNTVLIVDDNSDFVEEATELLRNAGYRVRSAANHQEAIMEASESKPDIILLDIKFAGNGIKTAKKLGSDEDTSDIPIIVVSGHVDDKVINNLKQKADVRDVLEKTILPLEIIASIESNLDGS